VTDARDTWTAPVAESPLDADIRVPGSKSITNRAYVLAALASAPTRVRTPLDSRDARLMLGAISALGAHSQESIGGYLPCASR
jgi:3-phosphoshikimate 1-carboxyvinyltransferase